MASGDCALSVAGPESFTIVHVNLPSEGGILGLVDISRNVQGGSLGASRPIEAPLTLTEATAGDALEKYAMQDVSLEVHIDGPACSEDRNSAACVSGRPQYRCSSRRRFGADGDPAVGTFNADISKYDFQPGVSPREQDGLEFTIEASCPGASIGGREAPAGNVALSVRFSSM